MGKIHEHLKARRKALGLKQEDMEMRIGMSRQQYQRLESKGNPRLDTLELVAKGLKMELVLIPQEAKLDVQKALEGVIPTGDKSIETIPSPQDDPWGDLLEDQEN